MRRPNPASHPLRGGYADFINHRGDAYPPLCSTEPGPTPPVHSFGVAEDSRPSEDTNNNGKLDPGEDLNGNGVLDADKGIFSIQLKEGMQNLVLTTDSFTPGASQVNFRVDVSDPTQPGTGAVVVTDGAGNQCEQPISLVPTVDTDGDGAPDSEDGCVNDTEKTAPGVCGCGIADVDTNANGIIDCRENTGCLTCADDADGDGSPADIDCDDTNPEIHPDASEVLGNGTDDDCIPSTPDVVVPTEFSCIVVTDKDFYSLQETVQANVLVRRTKGASLAAGLQLAVKAEHENGDAFGAKSEPIAPLIPHEERALNFTFSTNSVIGAFTVSAQVKAGSEVVASCASEAAIASAAGQSQNLTGAIEADPAVATVGEEVSLHYSVRNTGTLALDPAQIKILVVDLATEKVLATLTDSSQLGPGAVHTAVQAAPSSLPAGEYLVILRAGNNSDNLSTLASNSLVLNGGGSNQLPVADAGDDRNVAVGQPVQLDGSESFDSDGDQITYAWSVVSVPQSSQVTDDSLTDKTTPKPTFTPDVTGKYVFRLVVNDGQVDSASDAVEITAAAANVPPNADAGVDQAVLAGTSVTLNGSGSNDPDSGPQPLTFSWTFVQVPTGSARTNTDITGANQSQASFIPDVAGTYMIRLAVSDGPSGDVDEAMIEVRVQNVPPIANAGADQTLMKGTEATLDGTGSSDPDNGPQPLTYSWRFVSKPNASQLTDADLIGSETATPKLLPDVTGSYVLERV